MVRYCCIRWGNWMLRDWTLYRLTKVTFGSRGQYTRYDWLSSPSAPGRPGQRPLC